MDEGARSRLAAWLAATLRERVDTLTISRLSGGAIQENWLVEAALASGPRSFVLRKDAPATIGASHGRAEEFALLRLARAAGVLVPEPVAFCDDASVLSGPFALMAKVEGVAFGPRIVKDLSLGGDREALVERLGKELALIHATRPPADGSAHAALPFLGPPPVDPARTEVAFLRGALDAMGAVRPALEWGLRWAGRHAPAPSRITLVHRDFRTGNYMVDGAGLTAILDWEFAGWGDPMADLGWFCARCWRFGRDRLEAGGIGSREAFHRGYAAGGGLPIDGDAVRYWEVMAHLRWAVIALQQGERHASGREPSLEHALTARIAAELELAVLNMTAPAQWRPA
jgi:aminoglycoside phosphotransferase (APT) family kinase protein